MAYIIIGVMNETCLNVLSVIEAKRKVSETTGLLGGMKALWLGVPQSDYASEGVGILLSLRLVPGVVYSRLIWVRIKLGITRVLVVAYMPQ